MSAFPAEFRANSSNLVWIRPRGAGQNYQKLNLLGVRKSAIEGENKGTKGDRETYDDRQSKSEKEGKRNGGKEKKKQID